MKNMIQFSVCACVLAIAFAAQAQPRPNTFYGKADLGGSIVADTDLKEMFGYNVPGGEVKFDPGVRFGFALGYNVTEWFATEFEVGMSWNGIDSISGAQHLEASLINAPFTLNAKFQLPNPSRVRPYIGAGVGGASSVLDIDEMDYGPAYVSGSASDVVFAWQGFAGVQFDLNEQMSLGIEYRYVWSDAPDFDIDWGWYYQIAGHHARFGDIQTHALSLAFHYQF